MPVNQQVPQNDATLSQAPLNITDSDYASRLDAARQRNLLMIQQLERSLEEAQQKELEYKAAQEQEQQQQQQQQQMIDTENAIRQLQQQLQHQQQYLTQEQQQQVQMQMGQPNSHNPDLRNLLQQQQMQARRQQIAQNPMMMQHGQGLRQQNMQQSGVASNVGQQPPQQ